MLDHASVWNNGLRLSTLIKKTQIIRDDNKPAPARQVRIQTRPTARQR